MIPVESNKGIRRLRGLAASYLASLKTEIAHGSFPEGVTPWATWFKKVTAAF